MPNINELPEILIFGKDANGGIIQVFKFFFYISLLFYAR